MAGGSRAMRRSSVLGRMSLRDGVSLVATTIVLLAARSSLADHYQVPSGSMLPTVHLHDRILVDKSAYGLRVPFTRTYLTGQGPERGDVVVLTSPEDGKVLLKRVIAVPGDNVTVEGGRLVLNGQRMPVTYEAGTTVEQIDQRKHPLSLVPNGGPDFGPRLVPANQYLVMGDNRGDSHDGRYFGWVSRDEILGRAARVYWRDGAFAWIEL